ncbi:MAG: FTR1 family protein [Alphaproteobacteria bacterium]|nr:FTR1 family protein [Alphaproteobacteria bacterium]MBP7758187.1 FTR1 family protein [Alphaproteobacteria bacterium]MBP7761380.1 FTR1 family protein [Alphaproteobacteria bacterium]MBP7906186.1 FTR1 family protein [Alphaproteobacteria bacterium]
MFSTAVIVFREVFEIVLIVGIVIAATQAVPKRWMAVGMGFGLGIFGSLLVAFFTGQISEFAEGFGQEYFNAGILFTAAAFIGWTLIWMKRHAREMKAHFTRVGEAVAEGRLPYISISIVIALAILREGAEISLFLSGQYYSQIATVSELMAGSLIGFVGGSVVGILLYLGLIQISTRAFLQVTSWLLALVVAGMVVQAVGFLTAADNFQSLSFTLWDTSWLLSEENLAGESLKALVGYTAQPSAIQLIAFVVTLVFLTVALKFAGRPVKKAEAFVSAE